MNKRDISWLIVRVVGLGLILNACRYLFIVMENVMMATNADVGKTLLSQGSGLIVGWIIEATVCFVVGLYLLKNGEFLFHLVDYAPDK